MDTIKIVDKKNTQMIAHRGLSGIERENSIAAFVAAANRTYFGMETDVHVTADGKFVIIHDSNPARISGVDMWVEDEQYDKIREVTLYDTDDYGIRCDLKIPNLEEYIRVCKKYDKHAVLELKNEMTKQDVSNICDVIKQLGYIDNTIFISFNFDNLVFARELCSEATIQFLTCDCDNELIEKLKKYKMHLDIEYSVVNKELVDKCHSEGILINCWTIDDADEAQKLVDMGVDFITTDILE